MVTFIFIILITLTRVFTIIVTVAIVIIFPVSPHLYSIVPIDVVGD